MGQTEEEKKVKASYSLDQEVHSGLKETAAKDGRTPANLLNYLLKIALPLYSEEVDRKQAAVRKGFSPKEDE